MPGGMRMGQMQRRGPAIGQRRGLYTATSIRLETDLFNRVRDRALHERTSLSEQIRLLIEWGLESAEEAER